MNAWYHIVVLIVDFSITFSSICIENGQHIQNRSKYFVENRFLKSVFVSPLQGKRCVYCPNLRSKTFFSYGLMHFETCFETHISILCAYITVPHTKNLSFFSGISKKTVRWLHRLSHWERHLVTKYRRFSSFSVIFKAFLDISEVIKSPYVANIHIDTSSSIALKIWCEKCFNKLRCQSIGNTP